MTSAAAVAGGFVLAGQLGGYAVDDDTRQRLRSLSDKEYVILQAAARRILAPDRSGAPSADDIGVSMYVDGWLAEADRAIRRDFGRLLRLVEHGTPLFSGRRRRFTDLPAADQDAHLRALSHSSIGVVREGFAALKSMCMMGYWRDPRTFAICGYEGPVVPRGWTGGE